MSKSRKRRTQAGRTGRTSDHYPAGCASLPFAPLKLCHNKPSACFVFVAAASASPALAVVVVAASSPVAVAFAATSFAVVVAASSPVAVVVVV